MALTKLNYISNLSLEEFSGGGSAVNKSIFDRFNSSLDVDYIGPIKVPINLIEQNIARVLRVFGIASGYPYFSKSRLARIRNKVNEYSIEEGDANYFHGITPWIDIDSKLPYFAFTDACFHTYVNIYNNVNHYSKVELNRIYKKEAEWITGASKVFFRSKWAMENAINSYGISESNLQVVRLGGFIEIPEKLELVKEKYLLFISREFVPKGGIECFEAFKRVNNKYKNFRLKIFGEKPPREILEHPGVDYLGFINKNDQAQYFYFKSILSKAYLLIHPTRKDINPLVLVEAGYYGCPCISVNGFAVPEIILDKVSGFLVKSSTDINSIVDAIECLIENPTLHANMVINSHKHTVGKYNWDSTANEMVKVIQNIVQ